MARSRVVPDLHTATGIMRKCTNELWAGVECDLPAGHKGPHHREACAEGAALSWRSSMDRLCLRPSQPELRPAMFSLSSLRN